MLLILQKFIWENVRDLLTFPLWWYSRGFKEVFFILLHSVKRANENMGVGLWISNLFTPMYGQSDWEGRIISFFMRLVQIIGRSIAFVVWLIIVIALMVVWLGIVPLTVFGLVVRITDAML